MVFKIQKEKKIYMGLMMNFCIDDSLIEPIIDIFKSNCRPDYILISISGHEFVKHFKLEKEDIDEFFNYMCYEISVLSINPGEDEVSFHWQENNFGLTETYLTQLKREIKLDNLNL